MNTKELITLYVETNCNTDNTKKSYSDDLKYLFDFLNKECNDVTPIDIVEWKNSMNNLSSATVNKRLGSAKRFFTFLFDNNYISTNPAKVVKSPKVVNKNEDTLTRNDVERLIQNGKNPRDKAIIAVLANTGLRVSELCNIKIDDIDSEGNIKILGKGQKWRLVHLNPKVRRYVNDYIRIRKTGCDNLFVSNQGNVMSQHNINHTLKTLGKRVGIENIHPHMLRHYYATSLLDNAIPIEQIQLTMGHSNINTTLRYAEIRNKRGVVENIMEMELI